MAGHFTSKSLKVSRPRTNLERLQSAWEFFGSAHIAALLAAVCLPTLAALILLAWWRAPRPRHTWTYPSTITRKHRLLRAAPYMPTKQRGRFRWARRHSSQTIMLAIQEARRLGQDYVDTEHILLALLRQRSEPAATLLENLGVDLNDLNTVIEFRATFGNKPARPGPGLTEAAKRVIERAFDESRALNDDHIGTEHFLLALLGEPENGATHALISFGVQYRDVLAELRDRYRSDS